MAIVKMDHLRLLAMRADRQAILWALQRLGCVEITEPQCADSGLLDMLERPDKHALERARAEQQSLRRALDALARYAPVKEGLFRERPVLSEEEFFDADRYAAALTTAQQITDLEHTLQKLTGDQNRIAAQRSALQPWLAFSGALDAQPTASVYTELGILPAKAELPEAPEGLAVFEEVSADKERRFMRLICHRSVQEQTLALLREAGWSKVTFPDARGTAAESDERLSAQNTALEKQCAELREKLAELGAAREELRLALDRADVMVQRLEAGSCLRDTEQTFCLEGWIEQARIPAVKEALAPFVCAWETQQPTEEEYGDVPIRLQNNRFTRPLSMVTEMYSLPRYGTVDPNPLTAPFFILFYGMMMADMGYGLLMFLAGRIITKKYKPKGTSGHLFSLLELGGISTFIFGALTGGFFGDFIPQLCRLINPASTFELPHLFTPMDDTTAILIGSLCLGAVQILTGMAISAVQKIRHGDYQDALWNEVTWWVVFAGIALMVLKVTPIILYVGAAMVLVGAGWDKKGFGKVTAIFSSLYNNVTGYFGDILSYSRLMALMLSGSVLAQVFNMLGTGFGNVPMFILISMIGNLLNFALNLLGCYVHDMRLQCLEYYGKFYVDGGRPFRPLAYETKYNDIET